MKDLEIKFEEDVLKYGEKVANAGNKNYPLEDMVLNFLQELQMNTYQNKTR